MEDETDVEAALKKDKGHMGKRYIEVFESQVTEHRNVVSMLASTC